MSGYGYNPYYPYGYAYPYAQQPTSSQLQSEETSDSQAPSTPSYPFSSSSFPQYTGQSYGHASSYPPMSQPQSPFGVPMPSSFSTTEQASASLPSPSGDHYPTVTGQSGGDLTWQPLQYHPSAQLPQNGSTWSKKKPSKSKLKAAAEKNHHSTYPSMTGGQAYPTSSGVVNDFNPPATAAQPNPYRYSADDPPNTHMRFHYECTSCDSRRERWDMWKYCDKCRTVTLTVECNGP